MPNVLFHCPVCRRDDRPLPCKVCGFVPREQDGIVELTASTVRTELDDIDYDSVYDVDVGGSFAYLQQLRNALSPLLEGARDTVVEIGSGTGFLSVPLARDFACRELVLTDVSRKMLAVCRSKIERHAPQHPARITYALVDGNHFCVNSESVDLVFGHGVLHHVFEYGELLSTLARTLRARGIAVFVEPNYRFHVALLHILERVVLQMRLGMDFGSDAQRLLGFIQHLMANWKFRGDREFVAGMEDKHQFVRAELCAAANRAGFAATAVQPAYEGADFVQKMKGYARELGLSEDGTRRVLEVVAEEQILLEEILDEECWSSADIYTFARDPGMVPAATAATRSRTARRTLREIKPAAQRICRHWVDSVVREENGAVSITGWIVSDVPLRHVAVKNGEAVTLKGYVIEVRRDVMRHLALDPELDCRALVCAGFRLHGTLAVDAESLAVEVEFIDGASRNEVLTLPRPGSQREKKESYGSRWLESTVGRMVRRLRGDRKSER